MTTPIAKLRADQALAAHHCPECKHTPHFPNSPSFAEAIRGCRTEGCDCNASGCSCTATRP